MILGGPGPLVQVVAETSSYHLHPGLLQSLTGDPGQMTKRGLYCNFYGRPMWGQSYHHLGLGIDNDITTENGSVCKAMELFAPNIKSGNYGWYQAKIFPTLRERDDPTGYNETQNQRFQKSQLCGTLVLDGRTRPVISPFVNNLSPDPIILLLLEFTLPDNTLLVGSFPMSRIWA